MAKSKLCLSTNTTKNNTDAQLIAERDSLRNENDALTAEVADLKLSITEINNRLAKTEEALKRLTDTNNAMRLQYTRLQPQLEKKFSKLITDFFSDNLKFFR